MAERPPQQPGPQPHRPRRARGGVVPEPVAGKGSTQASASEKKPRRRTKIIAIVLGVIAVLVIAAVVIAGLYLRQLQTTFDDNRNVIEELDLADDSAYRTSDDTINVLLLGSDSRGDDEEDYRARTGEGGARSDVMMFVHIPADRSGVYVMSIMRDLWVEVPGHGYGRVNSALGAGGYELVVDMVEEMLHTHIDHVAVIDFEGFSDLTTALGGVYVDNPQAFSGREHDPVFFPEGEIRLEGEEALWYVRERKSFPIGDYMRVQNQQRVVKAIVQRFLSGDTLTNPQRVMNVVESIVPFMEVDSALNAETVAGYAMEMRNLRANDIHMFTMPTGEPAVTTGGAQVILPDEGMMQLLQTSLKNENMQGFLEYLELSEESGSSAFTGEAESYNQLPDEPVGQLIGKIAGGSRNAQ